MTDRSASASYNISATGNVSFERRRDWVDTTAVPVQPRLTLARGEGQAERRARSAMERLPRPMATSPDCTSSRMPKGSSTRRNASSLSDVPVTSMVTASGATSTTLARNSCAVSRTCERVCRSALTLTSSNSRCTDADGSSSTILMTLISLLSCFVTCSSGRSSTSTTTVIRETSACSVGPTASEWMLNPRRANSAATRVRTPGRFSTSTDRVCLLIGRPSLLAVPRRGHPPRELDVVVAHAGGHHRPDHRIPVDDEVDDDRHVVDGHGLLDRGIDVLGPLAPQTDAAVGVGELDEVRHPATARGGVQVGVRVTLLVEERLPLPDHTEARVVDHRDLDRNVVDDAGRQLLIGHLEAAVTVDRPDHVVGHADLGAHRGRHRETHRPEAAGVDPGLRLLVADELRRPHLVLADAGDVDGVGPRDLADPLDHPLRGDLTRGRLGVTDRVRGTDAVDPRPPGLEVRPPTQ